jgi:uncharacterized protein (DUF433 family)
MINGITAPDDWRHYTISSILRLFARIGHFDDLWIESRDTAPFAAEWVIISIAHKCSLTQENTTMSDQELLSRITIDPKVMVGKPIIKGTRLTVEFILNLLAHGSTAQEILEEYDGLAQEDIQACLLFASRSLEDSVFMPLISERA